MTLKSKIKPIIEDNTEKSGKWFDLVIQFFIVLSLLAFSIETLPDISVRLNNFLDNFELFTIVIFTIEYILRLWVSEKKLKFIFSFYALIDLFAILPFYLSFGIDLRSIRVFRLIRLFRVFKMLRFNRAIQNFGCALKSIKEELILYFILSSFLIFLSSIGIYYFENPAQPEIFKSIFHSMWWAIATLTTVGYGDIYPITAGGKIFTSLILLIGLGVVAVPTGLIASALSKTKDNKDN
ncbi:ion transporter [uncultured Draconibacterium sp.]|uniref:ion transporter n=1 Tax=uncultured Draconibacterium sp. TaxID=1573823 RepID=UPI0029C883B0|nr:ion transporter [uncultured Draconibacterium sp.]